MYDKFFSILIVIYPILSIYSSTILTLSVGDIILLPMMLIGLIRLMKNNKITLQREWFYFFLFITLHTIVMLLLNDENYMNEVLLQVFRVLIYYLVIFLYIPNFFNEKAGMFALRYSSLFVAIFAILQTLGMRFFGIYISGVIKGIPLLATELSEYGLNYSSGILRPRSILAEPEHVCSYLVVYTVIALFDEKKVKYGDAIVMTVAVICTVSSTGYLVFAGIWGLWCVWKLWGMRKNLTQRQIFFIVIIVSILIIAICAIVRTEFFELFIERTFVNKGATEGRFSGYRIFNEERSIIEKFLGIGFVDNKELFFASYPLIYWRFGMIGVMIFLVLAIRIFIKKRGIQDRMMLIAFAVLCSAVQVLFSYHVMRFFAFMSLKDRGGFNNYE